MLGSSESANLLLPCELELANKDIFQLESLLESRGIKYESDHEGDEKHCAIHACHQFGARADYCRRCQQLFFMLFSIDRRLGRPLGFPDVPLTNRAAIPASCNFSYLSSGDFESEGRATWDSSSESVM